MEIFGRGPCPAVDIGQAEHGDDEKDPKVTRTRLFRLQLRSAEQMCGLLKPFGFGSAASYYEMEYRDLAPIVKKKSKTNCRIVLCTRAMPIHTDGQKLAAHAACRDHKVTAVLTYQLDLF